MPSGALHCVISLSLDRHCQASGPITCDGCPIALGPAYLHFADAGRTAWRCRHPQHRPSRQVLSRWSHHSVCRRRARHCLPPSSSKVLVLQNPHLLRDPARGFRGPSSAASMIASTTHSGGFAERHGALQLARQPDVMPSNYSLERHHSHAVSLAQYCTTLAVFARPVLVPVARGGRRGHRRHPEPGGSRSRARQCAPCAAKAGQ